MYAVWYSIDFDLFYFGRETKLKHLVYLHIVHYNILYSRTQLFQQLLYDIFSRGKADNVHSALFHQIKRNKNINLVLLLLFQQNKKISHVEKLLCVNPNKVCSIYCSALAKTGCLQTAAAVDVMCFGSEGTCEEHLHKSLIGTRRPTRS